MTLERVGSMGGTSEQLVDDSAAELLKAFHENYPLDVPPRDHEVTQAYRLAARKALESVSPAARAAFIVLFAKSCKIDV